MFKVARSLIVLMTSATLFFSFGYSDTEENAIQGLIKLGKGFTAVGKKAMPGVVFIKSQANAQQVPQDFDNFFEHFRHFFEDQSPRMAQGSGFLVSADGYIVTNNHVVKEADEITVTLNDGEEYTAKIIGQDARTDLAVIKIEGKDLPYLKFGSSDAMEVGEWVIAIGNPFGLQATLTAGIVSAKGRQNLHINDLEDFIQTDAAINPGNSGGPLLNLNGEVIGINAAIFSRSGGYMGIGFAIPSNMAKHVINQIINNGSVHRGYLGVNLQAIDKEMAEAFNLEKAEGALISDVLQNSAAEKAGLKEGDIIVEYDDKPVKSIGAFRNDISLLKPGNKVQLTILRDNKKQKITVTLGQNPQELLVTNQTTQLGIEVAEIKDISPDILHKWGYQEAKEGVIITSVKRNSLAAKSGIRPGMLLLQVNQKRIQSAKDFNNAMKESSSKKHILLLVRFQNVTRFVTIKVN